MSAAVKWVQKECKLWCYGNVFHYAHVHYSLNVLKVSFFNEKNNICKEIIYFLQFSIHILLSYALTGHFIRYTLLVLGPPFAFRTALIIRGIDSTRCWKHFSEILVHIDTIASHSCCRFVGCTSMMRISRYTTSQRCSVGLRSGDCGGHLSKVNSLSCSWNQSEMIWALWHGALSCWK